MRACAVRLCVLAPHVADSGAEKCGEKRVERQFFPSLLGTRSPAALSNHSSVRGKQRHLVSPLYLLCCMMHPSSHTKCAVIRRHQRDGEIGLEEQKSLSLLLGCCTDATSSTKLLLSTACFFRLRRPEEGESGSSLHGTLRNNIPAGDVTESYPANCFGLSLFTLASLPGTLPVLVGTRLAFS